MADSASIEEANKIRASLGLPALGVPGANPTFKDEGESEGEEQASTVDTRQAQSYDNWEKHQEEQNAKRRRDEKAAAIKKARIIAQRNVKLEGPTLGEDDGGDLDTKAWLMQANKRQKKIEKERARKLAEEMAERERLEAIEYTSLDLAGVKVGHTLGSLEDGEDHILTLRDAGVNEDAEDELQDIHLVDQERTKELNEIRKRKAVYNPNDEQEGILQQYDEEIDGKKRKRFTLDGKGSTAEQREAKRQEISEKLKREVISLDFQPDAPISDYMDISEIKIKKPKKKKAKSTRQRPVNDEDISPADNTPIADNGSMDIDSTNGITTLAPRKSIDHNTSFVDDDDLQALLAVQRRAAFKKRKKMRPENVANQLREEESQTPMETDTPQDDEEEPGLILDETKEFLGNLSTDLIKQKERDSRPVKIPAPQSDEGSMALDEAPTVVITEDIDMDRPDDQEDNDSEEFNNQTGITGTGMEEPSLDVGIGATLNLLRQRGVVKSDASAQNALERDRARFVVERIRRETEFANRAKIQREKDRQSGKLDNMSAREREEHTSRESKQREQMEARQTAELFDREYKPNVQLKYVDEFGRHMNQKEAFKELSHQFHGAGSGNMKTEKRLKKIEQERKREAKSVFDPVSLSTEAARKKGQAGVRLQ
ncbi:hypothetical protein N7495_003939 [Penicillium taxi]|uniref:uncharacterized protein n=1 Tax=Penicillium taxi TaxID=168475 RepID=UPI002545B04E|nr:uncharacterized protein N7495_003939 [Penicillium taxi]KAJ5899195.1 hypothetical protein N7495_003939 [Penicillium taxi]